MVAIRIPFAEESEGFRLRLPRLCIICGRKKCQWKAVNFSHSQEVSDNRTLVKSLRVKVPLCAEHLKSLDAGPLILIMAAGFFLGFICVVVGALTQLWVLLGIGAGVAVVSVLTIIIKTL